LNLLRFVDGIGHAVKRVTVDANPSSMPPDWMLIGKGLTMKIAVSGR
jgi:hypothetical protein